MYQLYLEDGYTHVPVIFEALDKRLSKAYLAADNETERKGITDNDLLKCILEEVTQIPNFDIEAVGFEDYELDIFLAEPLESIEPSNDKTNPKNTMPEDFQEFDENIEMKCKCPKCGYEY